MRRNELLRFARSGAEARLQELKGEIESIYATFPDLRSSTGTRRQVSAVAVRVGRTRRQSWTPAQRKAVSERMRKYWAARKAAKK
jgi:hypothetical protein